MLGITFYCDKKDSIYLENVKEPLVNRLNEIFESFKYSNGSAISFHSEELPRVF